MDRILHHLRNLDSHDSPVNTNKGYGFKHGSKWCEMDFVHPQYHMAVGQNQWYHFGVGAPPVLVYFSWDWDVH